VVVAGLETEEEVPILHLRLRKAWRKHRQRIVVVGPVLGSLEEIAWQWVRTPAGGEAPVLEALSGGDADAAGDYADVAAALDGARTVVLAGERLAASPGALTAAAGLARARAGGFAWVPRRTNARGNLDAGLLPGLLPGGRALDAPGPVAQAWRRLPEAAGLDTRAMLEAAVAGELDALYLVGVDLAGDFEDPALAAAALEAVDTVIVQDLLPNATTRHADVLLPALPSQERVGSFTTWEGRRQPFPQALLAQGLAQQDWDIIRQLARALGVDLGWETAGDVRREAAPLMAAEGALSERLPQAGENVVTAPGARDEGTFDVVALDWLLSTESTMLLGADNVTATARPFAVWVNDRDARRLGVGSGQHVAISGPAGRVELPAKVTPAVVSGCVVVPRRFPGGTAGTLGSRADGALRVTLERVDGFTAVHYPKPHDVSLGTVNGAPRAAAFGSEMMRVDLAARGSGPEEVG
jgi:NADH-quinone oxidoreductase subunit G